MPSATAKLSRKFCPQSIYEPVWFGCEVHFASSSSNIEGLKLARKIIGIGAQPVLKGLNPQPIKNTPEEPCMVGIPVVTIPTDLEIIGLSLEFGQTWQITKPFNSSLSPSLSTDVLLDNSQSLEHAVSEGWEELITSVYLSVEDLLVAGGRWSYKLSDIAA